MFFYDKIIDSFAKNASNIVNCSKKHKYNIYVLNNFISHYFQKNYLCSNIHRNECIFDIESIGEETMLLDEFGYATIDEVK